MNFLDEVKNHPKFKELMKLSPVVGYSMFQSMADDFEKEWPGFLEERDKLRQAFRFQRDAYSDTKTFRQVAVIPVVVTNWIKFLNGGNEPSKEFFAGYLKKHPEYWVVDKL
jgi:hypothetical protein